MAATSQKQKLTAEALRKAENAEKTKGFPQRFRGRRGVVFSSNRFNVFRSMN